MNVPSKICFALLIGLLAACGERPAPGHAHHHHDTPHGGTGVTLGGEEAHVEFVRDAAVGKITAYILSAHMADFVRLPATNFTVTATVNGKEETLLFQPVANAATGEKAGDTAQFEAQADWLKTNATFEAVLKELAVHGKTYSEVKFNFPKGNDVH